MDDPVAMPGDGPRYGDDRAVAVPSSRFIFSKASRPRSRLGVEGSRGSSQAALPDSWKSPGRSPHAAVPPPESWAGKLVEAVRQPDKLQGPLRHHGRVCNLGYDRPHFPVRVRLADQVVELKDKPHVGNGDTRSGPLIGVGRSSPGRGPCAGFRIGGRPRMLSSVDFRSREGPRRTTSSRRRAPGSPPEGMDLDLAM